ncbi:hypothetical protein [Alicyclobacillus macrosporangiidus]|uniref:hypothetical protein n=1 Tax=Alicyclobacillus macrosporangiidus TaxID=392015 RepID=UPI00055098F4|nr:hypothetical protein [Alicyclobacillus macrosporangiidus]
MKLKSSWKRKLLGLSALVLAAGAGYAGGTVAGWRTAGQALTSATTLSPAGEADPGTTASSALPGLVSADDNWMEGILKTPVHDASGHVVRVSSDRPVLVVAYWCPYCHKALQLLSQNHLLDKVQILAVFFNSSEGDQKPVQVTSVEQAKSLMAQSLKSAGVPESKANDMLYALPSDGMDSQIQAVPDLLVRKQGKWYVLKGFVPDVHTWQQVLD